MLSDNLLSEPAPILANSYSNLPRFVLKVPKESGWLSSSKKRDSSSFSRGVELVELAVPVPVPQSGGGNRTSSSSSSSRGVEL